MESRLIRVNPKFEMFIENDNLFIYNEDYTADNTIISIKEMVDVELLFTDSFFEKMFTFLLSGWELPKNSLILKISTKNEIKEFVLTNCDSKKVEKLYQKLKSLIKSSEL